MTTTNQRPAPVQAAPARARSSSGLQVTPAKVLISDAGVEIHGYLMAREGGHVHVVWAVASGRCRHGTFPAEAVLLPSSERPWDGYPIPAGRLAVLDRAAP